VTAHLPGHASAADIAHAWGVKVTRVHRLAYEQHWRKVTFEGRAYYRVADLPDSPHKRVA
jgi:hypothetical protein